MISDEEKAIRTIVEARCSAVANGDIDGMIADVAKDVVTFDVVGPMFATGKSAAP